LLVAGSEERPGLRRMRWWGLGRGVAGALVEEVCLTWLEMVLLVGEGH